MSTRPAMVDPRQPRFGQAITGTALALAFVLSWPIVIPAVAVVLGAASLLGPSANVYAWLYRGAKRALRLGPPVELEEAGPPRFANAVGFAFLAAASIALYAFEAATVAWSLALLVSGLALLAAITRLCVGCEAYVVARRLLTRGRVPSRLTLPADRARAGA